jgi:hypothetical protein
VPEPLAGEDAAGGADGEPVCSGTRNLRDNLSDLRAQVAANQKGITLVQELIGQYSLAVVQAYMQHIQHNAEMAVRDMLKDIALARKVCGPSLQSNLVSRLIFPSVCRQLSSALAITWTMAHRYV